MFRIPSTRNVCLSKLQVGLRVSHACHGLLYMYMYIYMSSYMCKCTYHVHVDCRQEVNKSYESSIYRQSGNLCGALKFTVVLILYHQLRLEICIRSHLLCPSIGNLSLLFFFCNLHANIAHRGNSNQKSNLLSISLIYHQSRNPRRKQTLVCVVSIAPAEH